MDSETPASPAPTPGHADLASAGDRPVVAPDSQESAPAPRRPVKEADAEDGPKLILEQVVIALVLAFIFRAFVLEAFVIPTGSMAHTLLGDHMRHTCPDCGWEFTTNYDSRGGSAPVPKQAVVSANGQTVPLIVSVRCPNCDYRLPRLNEDDPDNDASAPNVFHGDRILVLKHLYLFKDPDRWDVVVFKGTSRSKYPQVSPDSTLPHQENIIKRLVALPGEAVMTLRGDVYTAPADLNLARDELQPQDFKLRRKSDVAQSALWRVVYDDDHRPRGLSRSYPKPTGETFVDPEFTFPWQTQSGAGWAVRPVEAGGGMTFDNLDGASTIGFATADDDDSFKLTDFLVYNATFDLAARRRSGGVGDYFGTPFRGATDGSGKYRLNTVSDLSLRFFYERAAGDGPLTLTLGKEDQRFIASIFADRVELHRQRDPLAEVYELIDSREIDTNRRFVEFENVDYRVSLKIDGKAVLQTGEDYEPDIARLIAEAQAHSDPARPVIEIDAANQSATLTHLSLWRDIYYTPRTSSGMWQRNATPQQFPSNVIQLGDDEYFVLGDNPFLSGDARGWQDRVELRYESLSVAEARVPKRFLLGKAFFVYWPAGYRPAQRMPAIIPNFGRMRFIE